MDGNKIDHLLVELACGDDARAGRAVEQLAGLPPEEIPPVLTGLYEMLHSPDVDRRWWAVRALAEIHDPRVPGWLAETLSDRRCRRAPVRRPGIENKSRRAGCAGTGRGAARSRPAGRPAGWRSPFGHRRAGGAAPDRGSADHQPHPRQRCAARPPRSCPRLAAIGDPRAVPALYAVLEDDSALLVYWAEQGLERMGVGMIFFKP